MSFGDEEDAAPRYWLEVVCNHSVPTTMEVRLIIMVREEEDDAEADDADSDG